MAKWELGAAHSVAALRCSGLEAGSAVVGEAGWLLPGIAGGSVAPCFAAATAEEEAAARL